MADAVHPALGPPEALGGRGATLLHKFLIAYEWQNTSERAKTPELKAQFERLRRDLQLPSFTQGGGRTTARDLGEG